MSSNSSNSISFAEEYANPVNTYEKASFAVGGAGGIAVGVLIEYGPEGEGRAQSATTHILDLRVTNAALTNLEKAAEHTGKTETASFIQSAINKNNQSISVYETHEQGPSPTEYGATLGGSMIVGGLLFAGITVAISRTIRSINRKHSAKNSNPQLEIVS